MTRPAIFTPTPTASDWQTQAACQPHQQHLFFPERDTSSRLAPKAKAICATCPVQQQCLEHALRIPWLKGIWGGMSERQREHIRGVRP